MRSMFVVLLCALPASAQAPRAPVQTEIFNGLTRTVRYSTAGLTAGETQVLREMERLENEASFLRELGDAKRSYIASERVLEPQRRNAQMAALSNDLTVGYPNTYAYALGAPGYAVGFGNRGFGYGIGNGAFSLPAAGFAGSGFGFATDEGPVKTALARYIAAQASTEYAAVVDQAQQRAMVRASASPVLRAALDVAPERKGRLVPGGEIRPAGAEEMAPVVLTLKGGEVVRGLKIDEKGAWLIVTLPGNRTLRLREAEVARIETGPSGIKPAAGE